MSNVNFFALGGNDEKGKNSFILESESDIFIINTGLKRPIVSKLGIDTLIANYEYLEKNQNKIKGVFISHANDENFAALPWLLMRIQGLTIYTSEFSKNVIEQRISKYKINHANYKIIAIDSEIKLGNVTIKTFPLASGIAGGLGFNFQTPMGDFIFMTNYIVGEMGPYGKTDLNEIKSLISKKGLIALILDSSRSNYHGNTIDYVKVTPAIQEIFGTTSNEHRIIVGAYDEDMAQIHEVLNLALKYDRPVVLYGRQYYELITLLAKLDNKILLPKFADYRQTNKLKNAVVLITGAGERLYQRFTRVSDNNDVYLKLKESDTVIMVAPPINGHEVQSARTLDEVAKTVTNIKDVSGSEMYVYSPTEGDILNTIQVLKPKYFIPIKGLFRYLATAKKIAIEKANMAGDRAFVLINGKVAHFEDGHLASISGKVKEVGDVIIDGFGVGDISYSVVREREQLAGDGVVSITIQMTYKGKKIIDPIKVDMAGVIPKSENKEIENLIISNTKKIIEEHRENWDYKTTQNILRKKTQKLLSKRISKEPVIVVTFYFV